MSMHPSFNIFYAIESLDIEKKKKDNNQVLIFLNRPIAHGFT